MVLFALLFGVTISRSQNLSIKWGFDGTQAGVSQSDNFIPGNADLLGSGVGGYSTDGANGSALVTNAWPSGTQPSNFLEIKVTATKFNYKYNSVTLRLKRSADGPKQISVRTNFGGNNFASDISVSPNTLLSDGLFYDVFVPINYSVVDTVFAIRIYGFDSVNPAGTLTFDDLSLNVEISEIALPVDLTYFKVQPYGNVVKLAWETAWEKNSREFIVERSTDLKEFGTVGRVPAAGDSKGRLQYNYTDDAPASGVNYYRLRMVDRDNTSKFSKVLDAVVRPADAAILVSPNPALANRIRIKAYKTDPSNLLLTNITGQNIPFRAVAAGGDYIDLLPKQSLSSGIYILSVNQNGLKQYTKVLVP